MFALGMRRLACWTVACLLVSGALARAAEQEPVAASEKEIADWIRQLDSDRYAEREQAVVRLLQAGPAAIEPVTKATSSSSNEVVSRAFQILGRLQQAEDRSVAEAAGAALQQLAAGEPGPVARRANAMVNPPADQIAQAGNVIPMVPGMPGMIFRGQGGVLRINPPVVIGPGMRVQIQGNGQIQVGNVPARAPNIVPAPARAVQRTIHAREANRSVNITENQQGVSVEWTETTGGKAVTTKAQAASIEELRKQSPEAAKIFDKYTQKAVPAPIQPPAPGQPPAAPGQPPAAPGQ